MNLCSILLLGHRMKKICLILVLCVLLSATVTAPAQAIDFKVNGAWFFGFDTVGGGSFQAKDRQGNRLAGARHQPPHYPADTFAAWQRVLVRLEAVASENLSGVAMFEIGDQTWGRAAQGGALGTDGAVVEVKSSYIDWRVPQTALTLRMGLQGFVLPGMSFKGSVFNDDVAGIVGSYTFNDTIALTTFWIRPYNDNFTQTVTYTAPSGYMDNADFFGLVLPLTLDSIKMTPWFMAGAIGPNVTAWRADVNRLLTTQSPNINPQAPQEWAQFTTGMTPAAIATNNTNFRRGYSSAWWLGYTGQVTTFDPWRIAWDINYGSVTASNSALNRAGWLVNLLVEYKMPWGTPGLYGWYTSGDDGNVRNGSEQMPYVSTVNIFGDSYSNFGFRGTPWFNNCGAVNGNPQGTWGLGARIKDMSFIEGLKSTVLVNYFGGTNDPNMAAYILGRRATYDGRAVYRRLTDFSATPAAGYGLYLTKADTGIEVNVNNTYKVYQNLELLLELGYIHLWLAKNTWGRAGNATRSSLSYQDAWKVSVGLMYSF